MITKCILAYAVVCTFSMAIFSIFAHETNTNEETVTPLLKRMLPDVPSKQVLMAIVSYKPGQFSVAHRHAGSVFAYVIEGEVISQLEGQPPITYKKGQYWYEPPRVPHLVSKNASATRPAKLLVWLVMEEGAATKERL